MKGLTGILTVAFDLVDLFLPPPRDPRKELINAALMVGAGLLMLTAFAFALAAAFMGLALVVTTPVACVLTGAICLVAGLVILLVAKSLPVRGKRQRSSLSGRY